MDSIPNEKESTLEGIEVHKFEIKASGRKIIAELTIPEKNPEWPTVIGLLVIDKTTGRPLTLNYNNAIKQKDLKHGRTRATLSIPKDMQITPGKMSAYLMVDIYPLKKIDF